MTAEWQEDFSEYLIYVLNIFCLLHIQLTRLLFYSKYSGYITVECCSVLQCVVVCYNVWEAR